MKKNLILIIGGGLGDAIQLFTLLLNLQNQFNHQNFTI